MPNHTTAWPHPEVPVEAFLGAVASPRVVASYRLTFCASLVAALINVVFGLLLAWALVRYRFPGKRLVDALVDLPFALPTAVAGISLTAIYAKNGWLGQYLESIGVRVAFTPLGVLVALVFIGLPFVVHTVQPVLEDLDTEIEEAAASLGAGRRQTVRRVVHDPHPGTLRAAARGRLVPPCLSKGATDAAPGQPDRDRLHAQQTAKPTSASAPRPCAMRRR